MSNVKGFKVFNPDWTCRGFQYKVGQTYVEDIIPNVCNKGFHFCKQAVDCFNYYNFNPDNKVAEVIALGDVAEDGDKCCTNKIQIVREIPWFELLTIVNLGKANSGLGNTGNGNTGNRNTGNRNTGNGNTGNRNTGNGNTGDWNTGDWNTGDWNTGNRNTGNGNTGNGNTGNGNTGNGNTGDWNTGDWNTGDWNTGDWNTGNRNTGNGNTGNGNQGDFNSGDFNISDGNTGCFNIEQHTIKIFDVDTNLTLDQWRRSQAYKLLKRIEFTPTSWIWEEVMSEEEKEAHPTFETTGGYLRVNDLTNAYLNWWDGLTTDEKTVVKEIPNFNAEKFKLITGINVTN